MATVQVNVDTSQLRQLIRQAKDQCDALAATLDQINEARRNIPVEMVATEPAPVGTVRPGTAEQPSDEPPPVVVRHPDAPDRSPLKTGDTGKSTDELRPTADDGDEDRRDDT